MFKFFKNKDGIVVVNVVIAILAIALVASLTISLASFFGGSSDPTVDSGSVSENSSSEGDNSSEDENVANYLTFTGDENFTTIALANVEAVGVNVLISDDAETWQEWDGSDYEVTDSTVYVRGYNNVTFYLSDSYHCTFSGSYSEVNGCVTALLDYENYDSIDYIESYAFAYLFYQSEVTSSVNLYMPDNVIGMDYGTFYHCTSLTSIKLSNALREIGTSVFFYCSSLSDIYLGDKLFNIGEDAFAYCDSLVNVYYSGSVSQWASIYIDDYSSNPLSYAENFYCNGVLTTDITIEGISVIKSLAFYQCSFLTSVIIGDGVTTIESDAFHHCSNLTSVTIGSSVTTIESYVFSYCTLLTSVTIVDGVTLIGDSEFFSCTSLTSVVIPDSVTSIGSYSFKGCMSLMSVTIGDSVTTVGVEAFYNTAYYNDTSNWEDGVLYIGTYLIKADSSVSNDYQIKDGTTVIAYQAFYWRTSLTSIIIPDSVIAINYLAFYYCNSLTSVTFEDTEGWYYISMNLATECDISSEDLSDTAVAATYLTSTYCYGFWSNI